MWWNSDTPNPTQGLDPEESGWMTVDGQLVPVWFEGPSFPDMTSTTRRQDAEESEKEKSSEDIESDSSDYEGVWSDDSETYE